MKTGIVALVLVFLFAGATAGPVEILISLLNPIYIPPTLKKSLELKKKKKKWYTGCPRNRCKIHFRYVDSNAWKEIIRADLALSFLAENCNRAYVPDALLVNLDNQATKNCFAGTVVSTVGALLSPVEKVTDALNCITKGSNVNLLPLLQKCVGSHVTDVLKVLQAACNPLGLAPQVLSCLIKSPEISGLTTANSNALLSCVTNLTPLGK